MLKKSFYLAVLSVALIFIGCEDQPLSPTSGHSNKISGETQLVEYINLGTVEKLGDGNKQIRQQVAVFKDISESAQVSGMRKIVLNHNYNSNNEGHSYGTFSIEAENGYWEGDWTGTTTSAGTTIKAKGYNFESRDQTCEWTYNFPSSQEGKSGTYSARIYSNRD